MIKCNRPISDSRIGRSPRQRTIRQLVCFLERLYISRRATVKVALGNSGSRPLRLQSFVVLRLVESHFIAIVKLRSWLLNGRPKYKLFLCSLCTYNSDVSGSSTELTLDKKSNLYTLNFWAVFVNQNNIPQLRLPIEKICKPVFNCHCDSSSMNKNKFIDH